MNEDRIALLKRCSRSLSRAYNDYPTDRTYADLQELEAWITELGGDIRTGSHRIIQLPEDSEEIKKELDSSD